MKKAVKVIGGCVLAIAGFIVLLWFIGAYL